LKWGVVDGYVIPHLSIMKNIVALVYTQPTLQQIIIIRDQFVARCVTTWGAAAPKLMLFFDERICTYV
jgi:hypothetical protein